MPIHRPTILLRLVIASLGVLFVGPLGAGETPVDKSGYNLFRPVPENLLRDFDTDRPDQTEGPRTLDAGHFQIEADLVSLTYDRTTETRSRSISVAPFNLRIGLLNNLELSLVFESWRHERNTDRTTGETKRSSGVGDFTTRLKINLWGNDGGFSALAFLPFVKWPTASSRLGNGAVEGGLILPLALEIAEGWHLSLMTEVDALRSDTGRSYHAQFVNSVSLVRELTKKISVYGEFFTTASQRERWTGQLDAGVLIGLTKNLQLDFGCNFGVTKSAPDFNPFVGISCRW